MGRATFSALARRTHARATGTCARSFPLCAHARREPARASIAVARKSATTVPFAGSAEPAVAPPSANTVVVAWRVRTVSALKCVLMGGVATVARTIPTWRAPSSARVPRIARTAARGILRGGGAAPTGDGLPTAANVPPCRLIILWPRHGSGKSVNTADDRRGASSAVAAACAVTISTAIRAVAAEALAFASTGRVVKTAVTAAAAQFAPTVAVPTAARDAAQATRAFTAGRPMHAGVAGPVGASAPTGLTHSSVASVAARRSASTNGSGQSVARA